MEGIVTESGVAVASEAMGVWEGACAAAQGRSSGPSPIGRTTVRD